MEAIEQNIRAATFSIESAPSTLIEFSPFGFFQTAPILLVLAIFIFFCFWFVLGFFKPAHIKTMAKLFFFIILASMLLVNDYFYDLKKAEIRDYNNNKGGPLAVFSHVKPTDSEYSTHNDKIKMTYKYGQLVMPKYNLGMYRIYPDKSVFAEVYLYWPDFPTSKANKKHSLNDRVRILFEIELSDHAFRDKYNLKESFQARGRMDTVPTDFDFPGLEGYRKSKSKWYYVAVNPKIMTPQGTPLTISCGIHDSYRKNATYTEGNCRIHLIFDEHLRAQIRFNMYLLQDWVKFYSKLITMINRFRQLENTNGITQ